MRTTCNKRTINFVSFTPLDDIVSFGGNITEKSDSIDNSLRVLITLMSHQLQSSDIVRHITSKEFSTGDRFFDLSTLFHTMMESLGFDHYVSKLLISIYRSDLNILFTKKLCLKVYRNKILINRQNKRKTSLSKAIR